MPTHQLNRRSILGGLATVPAAVVVTTTANAGPAGDDRDAELLKLVDEYLAEQKEQDRLCAVTCDLQERALPYENADEALSDQTDIVADLVDLIGDTPAYTLAGMAAKMRVANEHPNLADTDGYGVNDVFYSVMRDLLRMVYPDVKINV